MDVVELERPADERVVFERDRRDGGTARWRTQQIQKPRVGRGAAIFLRRPPERFQERRRVEDVATGPLGPIGVRHADDGYLVEVAVAGRLIVEQMEAAAGLL